MYEVDRVLIAKVKNKSKNKLSPGLEKLKSLTPFSAIK